MPAMIEPTPSQSWNSSSSRLGAAREEHARDQEQHGGAGVGDQQLGVLAQPVELGERLRLLGERAREREQVGEDQQHAERRQAAAGRDHASRGGGRAGSARARARRRPAAPAPSMPAPVVRQVVRSPDVSVRIAVSTEKIRFLPRQHDDAREREQVEQPAGAAEAPDQERRHQQQHERRRRLLRGVQRAVLVRRLERLDGVEQQREQRARARSSAQRCSATAR